MKYHKNQLQKFRQNALTFDEDLTLETLAKTRFPDTILALSPLHVTGQIKYTDQDDLLLNAHVTGKLQCHHHDH